MVYALMKGPWIQDQGAAAWPVVGFRDVEVLGRAEAARSEGLALESVRSRS